MQGLAGQPRGQAIVSFMAIVESLPTYGVHYYEVRDKHGTTWWLGLSPQGIAVYPHHDKFVLMKYFESVLMKSYMSVVAQWVEMI